LTVWRSPLTLQAGGDILTNDNPTAAAFVEWFVSALFGAVPLMAHGWALATSWAIRSNNWEDWSGELLFVVIATSGTAIMTVVSSTWRRGASSTLYGRRFLLVTAFCLIFIILSAMSFGELETYSANPASLGWILSLLLGSLGASFALEVWNQQIEATEAVAIPVAR
jgi:hypothetical protein